MNVPILTLTELEAMEAAILALPAPVGYRAQQVELLKVIRSHKHLWENIEEFITHENPTAGH